MILKFRKHPKYRIIIWLLLIISLIVLWSLNKSILNDPSLIKSQDFSQFWSAGRLLIEGKNPYNPKSITEIKNSISGLDEEPLYVSIAYNPPWALSLFLPFALIDYPVSRLLWLILNIIILIICADILWRIYGCSNNQRWVPILLTFIFGPTILVLRQGQITPLILLGIVGFLYHIKYKKSDWLAGIFAAFVSVKPQLFYLFWFAFLFWVFDQKRWKVLASFVLTLVVNTLIILGFRPDTITNYLIIIQNYSPTAWITPTIGSYLRLIFGWDNIWLQFIAPFFGFIWFLFYWFRNHKNWDWLQEMPVLLLVSLFTMSFGWTYDYVLALAAFIPAAILLIEKSNLKYLIFFATQYLVVDALYIVLHRNFTDGYFGWLLPTFLIINWLIIYLTGGYKNLKIYSLKNLT